MDKFDDVNSNAVNSAPVAAIGNEKGTDIEETDIIQKDMALSTNEIEDMLLCDIDNMVGESTRSDVMRNEFIGYYAGLVKIETITPELLTWTDQTAVFVSSQLGRMFPNLKMTDDLIGKFQITIQNMKTDFKKYVGNAFEKETTEYAQVLGIKNPQTGNTILTFSELGNEFIYTPGYVEAAKWWMCFYGSRDRDSEKEYRYEAEWMKTVHLTYVLDAEIVTDTGLRSMAKTRINNIIKTANGKLRQSIGFGISKSCPMIVDNQTKKRKQAKRRDKSVFQKRFLAPWTRYANRQVTIDFPTYLEERKKEGLPVGNDFPGETLPVDWFYKQIHQNVASSSACYVPTATNLTQNFQVSHGKEVAIIILVLLFFIFNLHYYFQPMKLIEETKSEFAENNDEGNVSKRIFILLMNSLS